ncbi:DNA polymerase IV [Falsigemmobacter faecalis]|uniref:DNA polymerase IV n=1 Tax=Falsigemmobacter faecalis TaxID=2488730 RepID=A0A3P3DVZ0_9RHOB|nr:DNA polymerase IV [Falsigemmobacter faecalis]RRH77916.1 DNA polymerase IV [Falsigemmobacter faecalis]
MPALCRDCLTPLTTGPRCPKCRSPRVIAHEELHDLSIAHLDCDAFYASVEKHLNPELRDRPLIVGGGTRGVVSTCCYIARIYGVRSAMPMFEARKRCPEAVIVPPRMSVYAEVSRALRARMEALTPAVEPLSLDEAFLDLTGTERLHGAPAAHLLARLAHEVERDLGISLSVGLSHNKFLAKIASDLDKPRGFSVIGRSETAAFLKGKPLRILWGVGLSTQGALEQAGIRSVSDILDWDLRDLTDRFGQTGERLWHLARGIDTRKISPHDRPKSISKETTFDQDLTDTELLFSHLWRLTEQVADRAKAKELEGKTVTVKVKQADHRILTRRRSLREPAQLADAIWRVAEDLLRELAPKAPFRLLGVGISDLTTASGRDPAGDLLDPDAARRAAAERAADRIRAKFGADAIIKGRALR